MRNLVELEGIIIKEVVTGADRTDFLLMVRSSENEDDNCAYIPCYTKGNNPFQLKMLQSVNIHGCLECRRVYVSEQHINVPNAITIHKDNGSYMIVQEVCVETLSVLSDED